MMPISIELSKLREHPFNSKIYGLGEYHELAQKIKESGWVRPLAITKQNIVISGHRRLAACKQLGFKTVECEVVNLETEADLLERLLLENMYRDKTVEQKTREFLHWKIVEADHAKERQAKNALRNQPQNKQKGVQKRASLPFSEKYDHISQKVANLPPSERDKHSSRSSTQAAAKVGMKRKSAEAATKVVKKIDQLEDGGDKAGAAVLRAALETSVSGAEKLARNKETLQAITDNQEIATGIIEGGLTITQANKEIIRKERAEKIAKIVANNKPLGEVEETFNVIYADPPWQYESCRTDSRRIENHYPTMSLEDICKLPVENVAAEDCILFLWATSPKLPDALKAMVMWGFEYKTCAIWKKDKIGMGYYFRQQHELLLVGTMGSLPVPEPANRVSSTIEGDRTKHSKKPDIVYEIIEAMYPEYPKIELFCREAREGWRVWGNQDFGDILLEEYSNYETKRLGWLSSDKLTDYIAYYIEDVGKVHLLPFLLLQTAWLKNYRCWLRRYSRQFAVNKGYTTSFIAVPIQVVTDSIIRERITPIVDVAYT